MSHGGARQGSGRKPVKNKAQSRVVRVPESIAPTVKRVIDALKNNPNLEKQLLDVIYSQGHAPQLQQMRDNLQATKEADHQPEQSESVIELHNNEALCQAETTTGKRCKGKPVEYCKYKYDGQIYEFAVCRRHAGSKQEIKPAQSILKKAVERGGTK